MHSVRDKFIVITYNFEYLGSISSTPILCNFKFLNKKVTNFKHWISSFPKGDITYQESRQSEV